MAAAEQVHRPEAPFCASPGETEELLAADADDEVRALMPSRGPRAVLGLGLLGVALVAACTARRFMPANHALLGPEAAASAEYLERAAAAPAIDSRPTLSFYVYRAGSKASYPLDNVNAADLAGVMWYLHNEVVVSVPRKYSIDRIRRFKLTMKTTQEFWNVHHRNFGAFLAFDAARCTTPICGKIFSQYGFIVGCQILPIDVAPYLGEYQTQVNGMCKGRDCNAGVWYSLPGSCPTEGFTNQQIAGNAASQDVTKAKSAKCLQEQPGGHCDMVNGAPDCTFNAEPAGEIMLDELAGIDDYDHFWNTSYMECVHNVNAGLRKGPCIHKKEFDVDLDKGVGCSFWDGKTDRKKADQRMKAVRDLFKKHYPEMPYDLEEPACDFDMYYDGETEWPINHTGAAAPVRGFSWEKAQDMRKTTTTTRPPGAGPAPKTCKKIGCGNRGSGGCDCNSACKKYNDCCEDYEDKCVAKKDHKDEDEDEDEEDEDEDHDRAAEVAKKEKPSHSRPKMSAACRAAQEECDKAVNWAKGSGFFEHPEWYKGLKATSPAKDFQKLLAKTKRGSCDKVCTSDHGMVFLKK